MMADNEDLGLSLSLNFPAAGTTNPSSLHLNFMPGSLNSSSSSLNLLARTTNFSDSVPSSSDRRNGDVFGVETRTFLNGIDVNRIPSTATVVDVEEEAGISSPNSTISSISGKRSEMVVNENETERGCLRGMSDDEDGENSRKKLRLSKDQAVVLEESFKEHSTLNPKQKQALAKRLGLRPRQVEVWFQNRRARTKLKQTEVDCEFLKRCCENLTEENRRLQKELHELRALKLSTQFYMQMAPPTTLTMCPSCERVAAPSLEKPANHQHSRHHVTSANQNQQRELPFNPWPAPANQVVHQHMSTLNPRA